MERTSSTSRPPPSTERTDRRADLDYLRVVCIAILLAYHVGMFFVSWDWHLKNPQLLSALEPPMRVLHVLRMPLLMLISGAGTALALERRSLGAFAADRTHRLFLPLVFGMLVVVPPQIYAERLWRGDLDSSYLAFWPSVLEGRPYPEGNTSWHHLWFVAYLFVYCVLALPLFAWLRRPSGRAFVARFDAAMARPGAPFLLFVPEALIQLLLRRYPETHALFDDPRIFAGYGWFFLAGHLLARSPAAWARLTADRRAHLAIGIVLLAVLLPDGIPFPFEHVAVWAMAWAGMLAALGYARAHVRARPPWLAHAQALAYPFYIWHQTVIVILALGLLRWDPALGAWGRFALLLSASFLVSWALSEGVARIPFLRACFGISPRRPVRS